MISTEVSNIGTRSRQRDASANGVSETVLGDPIKADYDLVLAHEHLLIDIRCYLLRDSPLVDLAVVPDLFNLLIKDPNGCRDNLLLDDPRVACDELGSLRGINALLIDVTPDNVGRNSGQLREISAHTGVDIVMGCGPYIDQTHDETHRSMGPDDWERSILAQLDGLPPRSSVIGEIGTSDPMSPTERNALVGAVRAQRARGVPLYVHLAHGRNGHEVLSTVETHGGDISRTVLCHLDAQIPAGLSYHRELLERGCMIAFDVWGYEAIEGKARWPTDAERAVATIELVNDGYGDQLVHSQDVCMKVQLRRFGGGGYDHLHRKVRRTLRDAGMSPAEVYGQLAGNALRLLTSPPDGRPPAPAPDPPRASLSPRGL